MSQYAGGSYETQFEAQSDDEDNLYNVERILAEKGRKYLVQWEGIDPATGEKWAPDWVPKTDCTDDLIADWKREKAKMKRAGGGASIKSSSSISGSVGGLAPRGKSRPIASKTNARTVASSTSHRSKSPRSIVGSTNHSRSRVFVDLPAPRVAKRRRESESRSEVLSPVKRLKLGGPASPLPASPFDNDDGRPEKVIRGKRVGPTTYRRRKVAVVKSPSFPKLTGPYRGKANEAGPSRAKRPLPQGSTRNMKAPPEGNVRASSKDRDDNTDTETEDEDDPAPRARPMGGKGSPLKAKSEPLVRPQTRHATRTASATHPVPSPSRSTSPSFVRSHPTSSARTRSLPPRDPKAQREIRRKIHEGMTSDTNAEGLWPRVVTRDERASKGGDDLSTRASFSTSGRKSEDVSIAKQPGLAPVATPINSGTVAPAPAPGEESRDEVEGEMEREVESEAGSEVEESQDGKVGMGGRDQEGQGEDQDGRDGDQEEEKEEVPEEDLGDNRGETWDMEENDIEGQVTSSPSLGGDGNDGARIESISPIQDSNTLSPDRQILPLPQPDLEELAQTRANVSTPESDEAEPADAAEELYDQMEGDVSMAHVMEVDALLSSNFSQQSAADEHDEQPLDLASVLDLDDSVIDLAGSTLNDADHVETPAEDTAGADTQPFIGPSTPQPVGRVLAPDSQPVTESGTEAPEAVQSIISRLLPGILDSASQSHSRSQSLPLATQDRSLIPPALPPEIISDILTQPIPSLRSSAPLPFSQPQPQDKTHSSIEDPSSSWSLPRPGQLPPPADTISTFTPTNPSIKAPLTIPTSSVERILPSSLIVAINGYAESSPPSNRIGSSPQAKPVESSPRTNHERIDVPASSASHRPSELGAVPDMSVDVFRRQMSPGSDIGQFSSPPKPPSVQASPASSDRMSTGSYKKMNISGPSASTGSRYMFEPVDSAEQHDKIQAQALRIETLLAEVANLKEAKKASEAEAAALADSNTRLNDALEKERADHALELQAQSEAISALNKELEGVRTQFEISESQREFVFEQYSIASVEAKRLSDENKKLDDKVQTMEKQLQSGLRQWRLGFESSVAQHRREIQMLKSQLETEREIYMRSKTPEVCRRAAEWYELKQRIKELEEDCAEAERREAGLSEREREVRRRELDILERERALENSATRPSQSQTQADQEDTGLSQDDLQTETMLSDRSVVLASLDGPLGEEIAWMCSYREGSDKICGKVFDSMGMLLVHVLDAAGHSLEETCNCAQSTG